MVIENRRNGGAILYEKNGGKFFRGTFIKWEGGVASTDALSSGATILNGIDYNSKSMGVL